MVVINRNEAAHKDTITAPEKKNNRQPNTVGSRATDLSLPTLLCSSSALAWEGRGL